MASSFTTHLGIEEMTTGEKSGTWGTITNYNWDIMDRIASYKAVAITTNADTATLTVREASPGSGTENLQDGMYRVVKFTGALDSNCTVTIAPNTTQVFFIIINATTDSGSSGPYSIILSQGTGANVTVANGKSAIVYCDGAGGGAAVIDALANLAVSTLTTSGTVTTGGNVAVTGNVTATGTVEPAGDTAAGDDAAIGYTSAEGLILTGQGSTNDVTIKNDADADVITIATGATNVDIVGDVTASTVQADGDTAAGDNAAMGYTSAEGLILTGQGSTNDVTIKNDADADVLEIPTGSTNVTIVGDVSVGGGNPSGYYGDRTLVIQSTGSGENPTLTLRSATDGSGSVAFADGTSGADLYRGLIQYTHSNNRFTFLINGANEIRLDADALYPASDDGSSLGTSSYQWSDLYLADGGVVSLGDAGTVDMSPPLLAGTDHTFTGITAQMLAGGAISAFDLVCVHTTTSEVVEADASAYATARVIGIAPAAISDTATGTILLHGFIRDDSWNWTTGSTLYLSETAGAMTHTAPSTDGAFVQVVGVALSPDVVYINPSMDVIERA